jgi:hypothetical protein
MPAHDLGSSRLPLQSVNAALRSPRQEHEIPIAPIAFREGVSHDFPKRIQHFIEIRLLAHLPV